MNDWLRQKAIIKSEIQQKLSYPYLRKHIGKPEIADFRLVSLMLPFNIKSLKTSETKQYIATAMLIQIALDTHDKITATSDGIAKDQQLTVLAGDYFSGLHYQMLAYLKDIDMVRTLAGAVKNINESKIALYELEFTSIEDLLRHLMIIETDIIHKFYTFFNYAHFFTGISHYLLFLRLTYEKNLFLSGGESLVFKALKKVESAKEPGSIPPDNEKLISICDHYLGRARDEAVKTIKKMETNDTTNKNEGSIVLGEYLDINKQAEEG